MEATWKARVGIAGVLIACLLILGGCDRDDSTAPTARPSVSGSALVDAHAPCDDDVVLEQGSGAALRYELLDEFRLHARDDGVIEECEAIALAVGPRELDLRRVAASLENSVWAVTLIARDGCQHWAEFDALTGRAKGGGRTCPES
jgi:hypothetical protein